jgi:hypothetical protein
MCEGRAGRGGRGPRGKAGTYGSLPGVMQNAAPVRNSTRCFFIFLPVCCVGCVLPSCCCGYSGPAPGGGKKIKELKKKKKKGLTNAGKRTHRRQHRQHNRTAGQQLYCAGLFRVGLGLRIARPFSFPFLFFLLSLLFFLLICSFLASRGITALAGRARVSAESVPHKQAVVLRSSQSTAPVVR